MELTNLWPPGPPGTPESEQYELSEDSTLLTARRRFGEMPRLWKVLVAGGVLMAAYVALQIGDSPDVDPAPMALEMHEDLVRIATDILGPPTSPESSETARVCFSFLRGYEDEALELVSDWQIAGWDDPRAVEAFDVLDAYLRSRGDTESMVRDEPDHLGTDIYAGFNWGDTHVGLPGPNHVIFEFSVVTYSNCR